MKVDGIDSEQLYCIVGVSSPAPTFCTCGTTPRRSQTRSLAVSAYSSLSPSPHRNVSRNATTIFSVKEEPRVRTRQTVPQLSVGACCIGVELLVSVLICSSFFSTEPRAFGEVIGSGFSFSFAPFSTPSPSGAPVPAPPLPLLFCPPRERLFRPDFGVSAVVFVSASAAVAPGLAAPSTFFSPFFLFLPDFFPLPVPDAASAPFAVAFPAASAASPSSLSVALLRPVPFDRRLERLAGLYSSSCTGEAELFRSRFPAPFAVLPSLPLLSSPGLEAPFFPPEDLPLLVDVVVPFAVALPSSPRLLPPFSPALFLPPGLTRNKNHAAEFAYFQYCECGCSSDFALENKKGWRLCYC